MGNIAPCTQAKSVRGSSASASIALDSLDSRKKTAQGHKSDNRDSVVTCARGSNQIGKYHIIDHLGIGSSSVVELCEVAGGSRYALKIFHPCDKRFSHKVIDLEAKVLAKLSHPHILQLFEVITNVDYYSEIQHRMVDTEVFVLELACSGDMFEFISRTGPFLESVTRTYAHQLSSALSYMHSNGVYHRDLKLENMLLDDAYNLKLADFGLACVNEEAGTSARAMMFTRCGTSEFMAPEVLCEQGYEPAGADVWSLGVILFAMVAGHPPFQQADQSDWWFSRIESGEYSKFWDSYAPTVFSDSFKDLLNKIFVANPRWRISLSQIAQHPWFQQPVLSHEEMVAEFDPRKAKMQVADKGH